MDITKACEAFRVLLEEQQARIANANEEKKDFSKMAAITVGIIDGDGIGPLIMTQAVKVLELLLGDEIATGKIILKKIEGLTIENRMALGKSVPEDVLAQIKACDVLLKGPTTTPMGGSMETLYRLAEGRGEALEFKVGEGATCEGVSLKDLHLKKNVLISSLVRGEASMIPDGGTVIEPGDNIVVVAEAGMVRSLNQIVEGGK